MRELVQTYGSPLYVYQLDRVREATSALRGWLPEGTDLFYSLKANPHHRLVAEFARLGVRMEVSSAGELASVATAGADTGRCLYTGPGKTPYEIRAAIKAGVRLFSVESETERERLARAADDCATDVGYLVRINAAPGGAPAGLRMTGTTSQFGVPVEQALARPELFNPEGRAAPRGLHFFPATNISNPVALAAEFEASASAAAEIVARTGLRASLIDLGGGFAAPYAKPGYPQSYPELRAALSSSLDRHLPGWRTSAPAVAFESGRYLAAACGTLFTTVLDVKTSSGKTFVVLDAGTHSLSGMSGLGRILTPGAQPVPVDPLEPTEEVAATLVGPLCTPLDVLSRAAVLTPPRVGDVLEIPNVGAYGLTASLLGFLSHPPAAEVVLNGTALVHARRLTLQEVEYKGGING